jgi:Flp pilus assembly protein TadG
VRTQGWLRGRDGASAVEFVLVVPILIVLLFSIVWFGVAFNRVQGMQASAREAARLASVGRTLQQINDRASDAGTPMIKGGLTVTVVRISQGGAETVVTDGGPADPACNDTLPSTIDDKVRVTVAADPDANAFTIPLFGPVRSTYEAEAVFRCE